MAQYHPLSDDPEGGPCFGFERRERDDRRCALTMFENIQPLPDQAPIADFEASKTLARAREAVKLAVAKNNSPDGVGMLKAMKELEQGWQKGMDKIAERTGSDQRSGVYS